MSAIGSAFPNAINDDALFSSKACFIASVAVNVTLGLATLVAVALGHYVIAILIAVALAVGVILLICATFNLASNYADQVSQKNEQEEWHQTDGEKLTGDQFNFLLHHPEIDHVGRKLTESPVPSPEETYSQETTGDQEVDDYLNLRIGKRPVPNSYPANAIDSAPIDLNSSIEEHSCWSRLFSYFLKYFLK